MRKTVSSARLLVLSLLTSLALFSSGGAAQEPPPTVYAILFYSSTCPHCHQVITEFLIPLQDRYAGRVQILGFETSSETGNSLYWGAIRRFGIPQEDWVVPILIVGDEVLVGGNEIPARFPSIVEGGLASGGIDLPDFDALLEFLGTQGSLDTRYPGRRILRQASPAPEEPQVSEAAPDQPPSGGDSVSAADSTTGPDSLGVTEPTAGVDSLGVAEPTTGVDSAARAGSEAPGEPGADRPDSSSAAERRAVADSAEAAAGRDSAETAPRADSATAVSGADSMRKVPRADSVREATGAPSPEAPRGARTEAPSSAGAVGDSIAGLVPGRDAAATAESGGAAVNPPVPPAVEGRPGEALDLATAARELETLTVWDRFARDRTGNSLAVVILLVLVASLIARGYPPGVESGEWPGWLVPSLALVGGCVAAYLSFVELSQTQAVCGPVGDCNTVNQSEYAFLFGVLPVGVLGLLGYGLIAALWAATRFGREELRAPASIGLWAVALVGTAFSVYLTFLEPFVIGATCAWCLTSSLVMALVLWAAAPMAARVWPATIGSRNSG